MMQFTLTYRKDGKQVFTKQTNADAEVIASERNGEYNIRIKAWAPITLEKLTVHGIATVGQNDRFLLNGYQSWTDTREFTLAETENNIYRLPKFVVNKFAFDRYGDACFYPYSKEKLHGYDLFYARGEHPCFFINTNVCQAYLIFEVDRASGQVDAISDVNGVLMHPGDELPALNFRCAPDLEQGKELLNEVYPERQVEKLFGYTSWYHYYQNVNEEILLRDLSALDSRFNLFQIDDGYETFVGDWLQVDPVKFPAGLSPIVEETHRKGMKAGIWLAPFVAEEKSEVYQRHPEWFCRNQDGIPVRCGCNWSGFYALDFYCDEARDYIRTALRHYMDLGFDFFKLDFLYAVNHVCPPGKTRSMVAEEAYTFLRETLGDRLILGCGATPFNCVGKFDYLRVGPDVSLSFDDVWFMRMMHRERVSTKITLQNTVFRSLFDRHLFGNDPDVFILRDENVKLNAKQKEALLTVNALCGSVLMTSDNVAGYNESKQMLLNRALELFYNAQPESYTCDGETITVFYRVNGEPAQLTYHIRKGVLL